MRAWLTLFTSTIGTSIHHLTVVWVQRCVTLSIHARFRAREIFDKRYAYIERQSFLFNVALPMIKIVL